MSKKIENLSFFSKCAAILATVFAATVAIGIALSSVICDVLALGKDDSVSAEITINEINELAGALEDGDIIEYPLLFSAYVGFCELDGASLEVKTPKATVSSDMDYANLLAAFTSPPPVRTITLSFPEGATTDEIIGIFVKNGIGTREGFIDAINNYPFEYDFIDALNEKASEDRRYRLDGYLYPDTYDFYTGRAETYYIYKMLDRFSAVIAELGLSEIDDDSIVIASMIQSSTSNVSQYEYVSSAIHNRLNAPNVYPNLCCPATSAYAMGMSEVYKGVPSEEIKTLPSPYNTFTHEGLPPGAICNPNKNALLSALYPAKSEYKYYLTLESGEVILACTEWEHNKNCEALSPRN